jgi:hypothetical protein
MTLPELAKLCISSRATIPPNGNDIGCPPLTSCSNCPLQIPTTKRCIFWDAPFDRSYRRTTLIPYLHLHHPEAFL